MQRLELAKVVRNKFLKAKKKLAIAESCTGGALMAALTDAPGASDYLLGGVVCYANELKQGFLHVMQNTLQTHGAVSKQTVLEMIHGIFSTTKADVAVAISGIFGPSGGTKDKPVGTVFAAIAERGKEIEAKLIPLAANLSRSEYRDLVIDFLLEELSK